MSYQRKVVVNLMAMVFLFGKHPSCSITFTQISILSTTRNTDIIHPLVLFGLLN